MSCNPISKTSITLAFAAWLLCSGAALAEEPASLDALLSAVKQSRGMEREHDKEREERFLKARNEQKVLLDKARADERVAERRADELRGQFEQNEDKLAKLEADLAGRSGELQEIFGVARQAALESQGSIKDSIVTAQFSGWSERLGEISKKPHTLSIQDLEGLWLTLLETTSQNGKTVKFTAPVITAQGEEVNKPVTRVGVFNAVSDGRFLRYLPETGNLVELSRQPPARFTRIAASFEDADANGLEPFPIDPSRGAILSLIVHTPNLMEEIDAGGVIGYLILLIGIVGAGLAIYRYVALIQTRRKLDSQLASPEARDDNPLGRLRRIVAQAQDLSSKALSARLHQTIGEEATRLTGGLRTLGIIAAVAPLLGLLGTVTGMIQTFQSITLFGAGDPRIMSGGISEALVTTELGLAVAIPVLLIHSFLKGQANRIIGILDNQGSTLVAAASDAHAHHVHAHTHAKA